MEIKIGNYVVKSDSMNIWIEKKGTVSDEKSKNFGKETWTRCSGYHYTIDAMLDSFFQQSIRKSEATTMEELRNEIEETKAVIREIRDSITLTSKELKGE